MVLDRMSGAAGFLAAAGLVLVLAGCGARQKAEKGPRPDVTGRETPGRTEEAETGGVPDTPAERVTEMGDIHFDFDKYDLRPGDREILTGNGRWLDGRPSTRVLIEGHCDERGTVEYNLALGEKRARTARDFLVAYGISADRLDIISYGKERPLDPGHNEEAWATNRRCHFVPR